MRTGSDTVYVVDVKMSAIVQKLEAVQVQATKPKPSRGSNFGPEIGASEAMTLNVNGALSPDLAGDLASMAAAIPGVSSVAGGISVLGLGPNANGTTLNGMAFPGADVPRDASMSTRVTTSTYDPARGWFSGVQTATELTGGGLFTTRRGHLTLDAPALQYADPVSRALGSRITNFNASFGSNGSMSDDDKYFYSYGIQGGRSLSNALVARFGRLAASRTRGRVARFRDALAKPAFWRGRAARPGRSPHPIASTITFP